MPQSSEAQQKRNGAKCHSCGWQFPNHHPSAKQRRAHKRHCGRMDVRGSMDAIGEVSDESNRGVAVMGEFVRSRSEVDCLGGLSALEDTIEGKSVKDGDGSLICSEINVCDNNTIPILKNDSHSSVASNIDSSRKEVNSDINGDSLVSNDSDGILSAVSHSSAIKSTEKSNMNTILNYALDSSDKECLHGVANHFESHIMVTSASLDDASMFRIDVSKEIHSASKAETEHETVSEIQNFICSYPGGLGTSEYNSTVSEVQNSFPLKVAVRNLIARSDEKDDTACQVTENEPSQNFSSTLVNFEDSVHKRLKDNTRGTHNEPVCYPDVSSFSTEIDDRDSIVSCISYQSNGMNANAENHVTWKMETMKSESGPEEPGDAAFESSYVCDVESKEMAGLVQVINHCIWEDTAKEETIFSRDYTGKEDATPFSLECRSPIPDGVLGRNIKEAVTSENSRSSEVIHPSSQCFKIEDGHVCSQESSANQIDSSLPVNLMLHTEEDVLLEKVEHQHMEHDIDAENHKITIPQDFAASNAYRGSNIPDRTLTEIFSIESINAMEVLGGHEKDIGSTLLTQDEKTTMSPVPGEPMDAITNGTNNNSCDVHNDAVGDCSQIVKACSAQPDMGSFSIGEKIEVHEAKPSEIGSNGELTQTINGFQMEPVLINTPCSQFESIPFALNTGQAGIGENTSKTVTDMHPSPGLTPKQLNEKPLGFCDSRLPKTDAQIDASQSMESITPELDASEDSNSSIASPGQPDAISDSVMQTSVNPMSGSGDFHKPSQFIREGTQDISVTGLKLALPNMISEPEKINSVEIESDEKSKSFHYSMVKNNGEISETPTSQSARRIRTPLKRLLESSIETQGLLQPDGAPQMHDRSAPRTLLQPAANRVVQKEWNSPARLPRTLNGKAKKGKGKPQWVPFMCCPSTNQ